MIRFQAFLGTITMINDFRINGNEELTGCFKLMSVENGEGSLVNFLVGPNTYFVDHVRVQVGDKVIGFYDANAPVPLIFPPQFRAIVMEKDIPYYNIKIDYFDSQLISEDGQLKLNIAPGTQIILQNDQVFTRYPANRYLIVLYGASTKSIPAKTTPYKIIVMCRSNKESA